MRLANTLLDEGHLIKTEEKRTVKTSTTAWGKRSFGAKSMLDETQRFLETTSKVHMIYKQYQWRNSAPEDLNRGGGIAKQQKNLYKTKVCRRENGHH